MPLAWTNILAWANKKLAYRGVRKLWIRKVFIVQAPVANL
jgi:hypothetical protein